MPMISPAPRQRWIALGLVVLTLAVYWLTFLGRLRSIDEVAVLSVTESLVKRGSLSANQIAFTYIAGQESLVGAGLSGDMYPHKGLLPSLLAVPLYSLALRLPGAGLVQLTLLLNPLLTALTASLVYLLAIRWGFSDRAGMAAALSFDFGTLAWHYGQTLFTEPSAALAWIGAVYCLTLAAARPPGLRWLILSGGLVASSVGASYAYLIAAPVFGIYLVLQIWRMGRRDGGRRAVAFIIGCLVVLAFWPLMNLLRFGAGWGTGYNLQAETLRLSGAFTRLYGLSLSPYRGLVWYVPMALAVPWGYVALIRRRPLEGMLCTGLTAAVIGFYSLWTVWWGAVNWGPRYLVPLMPIMALGLTPIWDDVFTRRVSHPVRWMFLALVSLSIVVQIVSILTDYVAYDFENWLRFSPALLADAPVRDLPILYDPRLSPLWVQAQALMQGKVEWAWGQDRAAGLVCLLGVLVSAGMLITIARARRPGWIALVAALAVLAIIAGTLPRATRAVTTPAMRELLTFMEANFNSDDVIVQMMPDVYTEFATLNRSAASVYGLPREAPLRPELMQVLERLAHQHRAVWLVSTGSPVADLQNGAEAWLVQNAYKVAHAYYGPVRLSIFGLPTTVSAPDISHAERLGTAIRLLSASLPRRPFYPGDMIPLTLTWQATEPVVQNAVVFIHLYDVTGAVAAQRDALPQDGYRPVMTWRVGEPILDKSGVWLPRQLAPGEYTLAVGMYDAVTGQRLAVSPAQPDNWIVLGTVQIIP